MEGAQRENPIECEVGDYVVTEDFEDSFGEEIGRNVRRMTLDGLDGKKWKFEVRKQTLVGCCDVVDVWERVA